MYLNVHTLSPSSHLPPPLYHFPHPHSSIDLTFHRPSYIYIYIVSFYTPRFPIPSTSFYACIVSDCTCTSPSSAAAAAAPALASPFTLRMKSLDPKAPTHDTWQGGEGNSIPHRRQAAISENTDYTHRRCVLIQVYLITYT